MKTVRLEDVESIMRWRDRSSAKDGYLQREMFDKYFTLVIAWERLKRGIATEREQLICYHIHKGLMKGLCQGDKVPLMHLGARVESMVTPDRRFTARKPMKVHQAIAWVADMDNRSHEAVRKQWNNWNKASTEAQHEIIQSFMNCKKSDFS
ncbi:hypothetical protein V8073_004603 [Vibrio parahaemolyticus]|uniref:hypothetical protein n=1 Tax=Vibrio harveyi group TaxID=717610 RepID=UPI00215CDCDB|nr:hypothetical protein [Vibrio parahaemolyticus]EKO3821444.1 hypothetical protein [Vibrio harveyi]EIT7126926.1 hypothetical protein [Vibrio parahaemolyticus]EIT7131912.1 hypothetical protein [Vibrio parahaemolyticus]EIZ1368773.1 hypothetical protein [Vibrio parahaemolyticus]EIZ4252360.1 hypothetical protein [Vibrio parahaemolyticus]